MGTPTGQGLVEATVRAVAAAWRVADEWAPKALDVPVDHAGLLVAALLAIVAVVVAVRRWLRQRTLRRRVAYAVLPSNSFAPSMEEILRVAQMLVRSRPASRWLTPRDALGVRVRLASAGEGRLVQIVEGPARSESVLRQVGYDQVELRPAGTVLERRSGSSSTELRDDHPNAAEEGEGR